MADPSAQVHDQSKVKDMASARHSGRAFPMRLPKSRPSWVRRAVAAGAVVLLAVAPTLAAESSRPRASGYTPTMADYLGIYDALQRYRFGVDKHDKKTQDSAFWVAPLPPLPPPGFVPPPGFAAGPPGPGGAAAGAPGGGASVDVWHLPLDSYIHFDSATRATHYEYFLSIYPQPERKAGGATPANLESRISIVGWPGNYEDVLEKRYGEWRILHRRTMINEK